MKLKLINLEVSDMTLTVISKMEDKLNTVDTSDFGSEREDAFNDLCEMCSDVQQKVSEFDINSIQERYAAMKLQVISLFESTPIIRNIEQLSEIAEELSNCGEDLQDECENYDCSSAIEELLEAIVDYQETYGGLGRLYI